MSFKFDNRLSKDLKTPKFLMENFNIIYEPTVSILVKN